MFEGMLPRLSLCYGNPQVSYSWRLGDQTVDLHSLIGSTLSISFLHSKRCIHCYDEVKSLYQGGYCYLCMRRLPQCDICMVKPHLCHYSQGTCRDENFAQNQCFKPHYLYLAKSDIVKVGITRKSRYLERWMEQGAVEASVLAELSNRKQVGEAEEFLKSHFKDRANWRRMLKNEISHENLSVHLKRARDLLPESISRLCSPSFQVYQLRYPVDQYPAKVSSIKLDKKPVVQEKLLGLKGQYLLFESSVFNVRSHQGYICKISF